MIIAVIGPTCSGKSKLADFIANSFDALVVNFDAFQIYREMNIGTAKPTDKELSKGNYYFYNIHNIDEIYDVAKYQRDIREFIKNNDKKNIVMVGGTGLYLKAALFDYKFENEDPMPEDYLSNLSNNELFTHLGKIDAIDAQKIGPNNRKRLLRALFIYDKHGASKTELNRGGKNNILFDDVIFIGLNIDRDILYKNIDKRVDNMFKDGLEEEVRSLFKKYGPNQRSLQAIGYKEFNNNLLVEEQRELIKKNTRNYAKRQTTFFKHQFDNVKWFDSIEEAEQYVKEINR